MSPRHTRQTNQGRQPVAPLHRGPQAASVPLTHLQPSAAAVPLHAPNAALLIDFDNVTMGIRSDLAGELKTLLSSDIVRGKVSVQRAYADWRRYPQYIVPLSESSIDLIFAPAYGSSKKNATDIRLAIDALELVFTRPEIGTFILLSGDSDFSSLVIKLKEYGKYVIGVGIRESSSDLLVQNCDEYYSYNALAGLVNTRDEEVVKWDPWELAAEAIQRMKRNGDVMRADRLKQVMQQIDSSFDEKNLGMSKFSRFVIEASHRSILTLNKMENGQYEVDLPKSVSTTEADLHGTEDEQGVSEASASAEHADDRKGPRSRGRKSWKQAGKTSGYSRGRSGQRNETDASVTDTSSQEILAADPSATELSSADVSAVVTEAPDVTPPVAVSQHPADVKASEAVEDDAGMSGMRLTRNEAFDLVRRAVAEVATDDKGAMGSVVRQTARRLLGRDSESLRERNFTRILQDAHNADIIDLRRRGNDFEVSPAAIVDTIADQLLSKVAEQKESETSTAGATSTRPARGMGPRGIPSRGFGKKSSDIPADLLSLGVVNFVSPSAPKADEKDVQPILKGLEDKGDAEQPSGASSSSRGRKKAVAKRSATKTAAKTAAKATGSKTAGSRTAAKSVTGKTAAKSTAAKSTGAKTATAKSASTAAKGVKRAPRKTAARKAAAAAKNA